MRRVVRLASLLIALVLIFGVAYMPRSAAAPPGTPVTKVYNLYATDGYYELPDGGPLYMYGFIGGQDGQTFAYRQGLGNMTGVAVQPTGGPIVIGQEDAFAGNAQFPAPIIYATTADVVEIRLKNLGVSAKPDAPNDPHSIHLHGLDVDAANDGVPETSLGAVPANLCDNGASDVTAPYDCIGEPSPGGGPASTGPVPGAGNVVVYMFTSDHAGTYMYHCHQEAQIHVQMGMFGALVIYEPGDPAAATGPGKGMGGQLYGVPYDKDYVMLVSEFDVGGHQDEEGTYPGEYNWAYYQPEYWSVNGLSFPQTIHASFESGYTHAQWLEAHPGYETLYTGSISGGSGAWGTPGEKALLRVINMGFQTHPLHMHGYHGKVIGSDARAWDWTTAPKSKTNKAGMRPFGEGLEKNTLVIGSGETYDWLVDFGQQSFTNSIYDVQTNDPTRAPSSGASTQSRYYDPAADADPIAPGTCADDAAGLVPAAVPNQPVSNTFVNCPAIPDGGDPANPDYIAGPVVTGLVGHPNPISQFFPFHNHDDYKATNNGEYPGGMFTFLVPTP